MHHAEVQIIADSINDSGNRLTTFQLRYWRPIHSELMTHRVFSRNAGSSRARPSKRIIDQVRNDPWGPLHWGANQKGMQARELLKASERVQAERTWMEAAHYAADSAQLMLEANAHKQIVNRILEPFTYIDVVVTATEYNNWFVLRDHPDAQPEIQDLARRMKQAIDNHEPVLLKPGEWHLPYILPEDHKVAYWFCKKNRITHGEPNEKEILDVLIMISMTRCARASYKAFDGTTAPIEDDIRLYSDLVVSQPLHASPAEHQATPDTKQWVQTIAVASPEDYEAGDDSKNVLDTSEQWMNPELHGNFTGWIQYRKTLHNEFIPG